MAMIAIDDLDRKILARLQDNGRMTNQELSEHVGLSPSPCLRRLKQLEAANVITRYVALVDPDSVGLGVTAFVRVRLDQQDDRHLDIFEQAIATFPEVMECYLMTGDADYQLRVLVKDLKTFEDFLRYKLTRIEGVGQLTTSFALRPVVYKTALPLSGATTG
ncbi:AsnC family transcriptional regulator [Sphingobium jiangsuense]|uniref:Lrp/AsnC family leucine-responsive transcriptional regulator n=1 Tax=Sphingobium jiangsuense TaxID=870476 RepID=A0A7W6BMZ7_9SPHN|nr:Lrp/AsnC family transcriptional regulator [Sphingobium jiangsuense]MBB3927891.1 Lrp/AsnC family leucine-responsive transcriptional regulator [Sphingobium jiangsuense]GLS98989.1 AsnC family transcriptional regulator [Sphingobium jiangsuense]